MYVTSTSTIGSTATDTSTSSSRSSLSTDDFYTLFIAELQNQDPTDPTDTDTLIQQTAAFSQLEKLDAISENIETLLSYAQSINNGQTVSFIGKTVTVDSDQLTITNGASGDINFTLDGNASDVTLSIYDSDGSLVRNIDCGALGEGENSIEWDSCDNNGNILSDGNYTLNVSAVDASGTTVGSTTSTTSKVLGLTFENGITYLQLENSSVPVGDVIEVYDS